MIPYFEQPNIPMGPLTIHGFGLMVAAAVLVGTWILRRRAVLEGLEPMLAQQLVTWVLVAGFLGAHLVDRFVYFPRETLADPMSILRLWEGLSSFGGFLGAVVGILLFLRGHSLGGHSWRYLDVVAFAFPFGWVFGRLGCFMAYDHPGSPTNFLLGQRYRDGVIRHNLGLEEALYTVVLAGLFAAIGKRRRGPGFYVGALAILYAPFRFSLDFLRKIDVRYLGLTPGQYGSLLVMVAGVAILAASRRGLMGAD
jgi:phosphatidylglycerol:prolipoprotein diacylglycerol transferase